MTDFKPGQYKTTDGRDAEVKYVDDDDSALYGHIWSYTGERLARIWLSDGTDTYTRAGDNLIPPVPPVRGNLIPPVRDNQITQDEMVKMFGETMPVEAAELIFGAHDNTTVGEVRVALRAIAAARLTPPVRVEWWTVRLFSDGVSGVSTWSTATLARGWIAVNGGYVLHRVELIGNEIQNFEVVK